VIDLLFVREKPLTLPKSKINHLLVKKKKAFTYDDDGGYHNFTFLSTLAVAKIVALPRSVGRG
jgi:hypothetical protein